MRKVLGKILGLTGGILGSMASAVAADTLAKVPPELSDLVGEWQLTAVITDSNLNNAIDEDERRDAITDSPDYLKFNADFTCEFHPRKVPGRYELKRQSSGKVAVHLFDQDNNRESRGVIHSLTSDELIFLSSFGGKVFYIFKRL